MSDIETKIKKSTRRHKTKTAALRQYNIAKNVGMNPDITEMHRFAKHHSLNCGNTHCVMCGNPRKVFNEKTIQERRNYQELDNTRNRHSNGLSNSDED